MLDQQAGLGLGWSEQKAVLAWKVFSVHEEHPNTTSYLGEFEQKYQRS